jgi:hypothetical protein
MDQIQFSQRLLQPAAAAADLIQTEHQLFMSVTRAVLAVVVLDILLHNRLEVLEQPTRVTQEARAIPQPLEVGLPAVVAAALVRLVPMQRILAAI